MSRAGLAARILSEWRRVLVPLAVVVALNAGVFAFGVYPLQQRVANIEQRDRAAEQTLAVARRDFEAAQGTLNGKERAASELETFYGKVLPVDLPAARRLTHPRLAQLADEAGLDYERYTFDPQSVRGSALTRVRSELVLRGTYGAMRAFIYSLETAPEFVVVDDVRLTQGSEATGELVLSLQLSTYFHTPAS
ncbi:MAG: hypothetical protein FJW23_01460 [Acidimicrobiia bacterium]|nr:hypothetical protein [Acidimicrobiia bacterium]